MFVFHLPFAYGLVVFAFVSILTDSSLGIGIPVNYCSTHVFKASNAHAFVPVMNSRGQLGGEVPSDYIWGNPPNNQ